MFAAFRFAPELMLTEEESSKLAESITTVTELYDVPILDEKTQAWIALAVCAGTIYGPRVVAIVNNGKNPQGKVIQFGQAVNQS